MPKSLYDLYGCRTAEEHRLQQAKAIGHPRIRKTAHPALENPPVVLESDDVLRLKCPCGNYPAVDPYWREARCFCCGLVYTDVVVPE